MDARQLKREAFDLAEQQRKADGREEEAANQAIRETRNKALAEGLASIEGPAREAGLVIEREGKSLIAKRGASERGRWSPDKRPVIRGKSIPCCSATAWLERLLR
jgi:hypothetical protein